MSEKKTVHIEENIYISLILTFIGGFFDAYTYVLYDKIFANTQTGNLIYLGIYLTEGNLRNVFLRLLPIIAFCVAIFLSQFFIYKFNKNKLFVKLVLIINIIATIILGLGIFKNYIIIVICLVSFICALMIGVFKKVQGDVFASIMCTGNLRSMVEFFAKWILYKERGAGKVVLKYLVIITTFILGVIIGIYLVSYFKVQSIYICTVLFFIVLLIMIFKTKRHL